MKTFNSLRDIPDRRNSANNFDSSLQLLEFYMELVNKGIIKTNSSGFKRLCQIKERVKKHENAIKVGVDEYGRNIKALQKSVNYRAYINGLIEEVDATENSLTTK